MVPPVPRRESPRHAAARAPKYFAVDPQPTVSAEDVRRTILATLPDALARGENPAIFGGGSPLDSLGLVNFLADLEYRLAEDFGREVVLASERAMSRQRSPFRDVDTLTSYVLEVLSE